MTFPPCPHCGQTIRPGPSRCPVCGPGAKAAAERKVPKVTLWGILPDGRLVSRRTAAEYEWGLVRDGKLVSCHWSVPKSARPDDVICRLVAARPERVVVVRALGRPTMSFARCYACDAPAGKTRVSWEHGRDVRVPACAGRHATPPHLRHDAVR